MEFLTKRAVDIEGWVDDVCPADGYGAKLRVSLYVNRSPRVVQDFNNNLGCDQGRVSFDPGPYTATVGTSQVTGIKLNLCTYKYFETSERYSYPGCKEQYFDNWRVS